MAIPMPIVQDIRRLDVFSQVGVSFGDPNLTLIMVMPVSDR